MTPLLVALGVTTIAALTAWRSATNRRTWLTWKLYGIRAARRARRQG
jgi:hypothetical protein